MQSKIRIMLFGIWPSLWTSIAAAGNTMLQRANCTMVSAMIAHVSGGMQAVDGLAITS